MNLSVSFIIFLSGNTYVSMKIADLNMGNFITRSSDLFLLVIVVIAVLPFQHQNRIQ